MAIIPAADLRVKSEVVKSDDFTPTAEIPTAEPRPAATPEAEAIRHSEHDAALDDEAERWAERWREYAAWCEWMDRFHDATRRDLWDEGSGSAWGGHDLD